MKDQKNILSFQNSPQEQNGDIWINVLINENNFISSGIKQFQLFENGILKESGTLEVIGSLLVNPAQDMRSKYQIIVQSIQATLAGVASKAQKDISIGDKKIAYYSAAELLSLLDYFKGKLKEEEGGYDTVNNEMKILYKWTLR